MSVIQLNCEAAETAAGAVEWAYLPGKNKANNSVCRRGQTSSFLYSLVCQLMRRIELRVRQIDCIDDI